MSYEWWIIGFLVWWMIGTYVTVCLCESRGWQRDDSRICFWLGWLVPPLVGASLVSTIYEELVLMWKAGWEKYGPDAAMEKEDL